MKENIKKINQITEMMAEFNLRATSVYAQLLVDNVAVEITIVDKSTFKSLNHYKARIECPSVAVAKALFDEYQKKDACTGE